MACSAQNNVHRINIGGIAPGNISKKFSKESQNLIVSEVGLKKKKKGKKYKKQTVKTHTWWREKEIAETVVRW